MFLKSGLGWLEGFPLGQDEGCVSWMVMPRHGDSSGTRIELTRTHLRDAAQTWNRLVRGFPRALPRLVDDPDRWTEGVPQILQWLKGAIHDGKSLPESLIAIDRAFPPGIAEQAVAIATRWPSLRPLLSALSWCNYLTPVTLSSKLKWTESNARAIRTILDVRAGDDGLLIVLQLCELAERGGHRGVSAILRFVGDPRAYTVATIAEWHHTLPKIEQAIRTGARDVALPQGDLGHVLTELSFWISRQEGRTRRWALDLLDLTLPGSLLGDWESWWAEVRLLIQQALDLHPSIATEKEKVEKGAEAALEAFKTCEKRMPPELYINLLTGWIQQATAPENRAFYREARKALQRIPASTGRVLPRVWLLGQWVSAHEEYPQLIGPFMRELRAYSTHLHRAAPDRHVTWLHAITPWHPYLTETILALAPERSLWSTVFEALTEISPAGSNLADEDIVEDVVALVALTGSAKCATRCFHELLRVGLEDRHVRVSEDILQCAWSLDRKPDRFAKIAAALHARNDDHRELAELLTAVEGFLRDAGWTAVTSGLVLDGEIRLVCDVGRRLAVAWAVQGAVSALVRPTVEEIPDWARRYPETLWPVLGTLSGVTGDAKRNAARVLGKDCPDPESVRTEVSTIERRLTEHPDDLRLSGRLRNLRSRTESVQAISPARLGRLKGKLERAVRRNLVVALQARLEAVLGARLKQLFEVDAIPDWMFEPQQLRVLAPMLRLSRAFRTLGLRLFRRRLGPPPWNLADDSANQAFLARLEKRGVNLDPWLNPPPPRTWTGSNGRNVVLAFESDPLEIFQMGWHFSTCLRPGDSNFFSVFANAADINKQVVYARDEKDRVVGRCLLALTEDGNLLTFESYCHDPDLELGKMIGQLATTLALRMNRVLVPRGKVPCLVAPDWYDDGPTDPCERFEILNNGSSFRKSLQDLDCDSLVARLEEEFDPLPLNSLTLSLVLEVPELEERPELIRPLFPRLEACKSLPDRAMMRAAYLAHLAGARGFAHRVLREVGVRHVLRTHRQFHWLDRETMTVLVELEPSTALRVLRKTRPPDVGSDDDEYFLDRRRYLARAYELLGREARANRLSGT